MSCKCRTVKACQQSYQYFTAKSSLCSVHQSPKKETEPKAGLICCSCFKSIGKGQDVNIGFLQCTRTVTTGLGIRQAQSDCVSAWTADYPRLSVWHVHVKCISIVCHQCQRKDKRLPILSDTSILSGWLPCLLCISLLERLLPLTPLPQLQVLFAQLCVLGS